MGDFGSMLGLSSADPRLIAVNLIRIALGFVGIVMVVMFLYAGLLWMTAGSDDEKVGKAKATIFGAIIGLIIVLSANSIINFVINALIKATNGQAPSV